MTFLAIVILLFFVMQTILLNRYYEIVKTRQLNMIVESIKKKETITSQELENLAYEEGVCAYYYNVNDTNSIKSIYNRGCIFNNKELSYKYIEIFINSGKKENTYIIESNKYANIIKALKYDDNTYLFFNVSLQSLDSSIEIIKSQYFNIIIVLVIVGIILAYVISTMLTKPIEKISKSAHKLANGNLNTSFKTDSNIREINELSVALEMAKNELSKTDELRRDLMANVGHDLRTPLTMIKAYAEMSRDLDNQSLDKKKENMNIIIEETDRLNVLVSDILDLSKIQADMYELEIEDFDLDELIRSVIKRYLILIDNEGYNLIYNNDKKILVHADRKRIEQVIYNLVNNAINYTGNNKKVFINVKENKKSVVIEIIDTGKGIPENEIKNIWNKYYHKDKKYKRNTYGTGLGLSIVKGILESHHYNYGVKSKVGKGTTFYFEISKSK